MPLKLLGIGGLIRSLVGVKILFRIDHDVRAGRTSTSTKPDSDKPLRHSSLPRRLRQDGTGPGSALTFAKKGPW